MKKGLVLSICVSLCAAAGVLSYYTITKNFDKSGKYFGMADDSNVKPFVYNGIEKKQKEVTYNNDNEIEKQKDVGQVKDSYSEQVKSNNQDIAQNNKGQAKTETASNKKTEKEIIEQKVRSQLDPLSVYEGDKGYVSAISYLEKKYGKGNVEGASDSIICRDKNYNLYYGYIMDQKDGDKVIKHFYLVGADGSKYIDKRDVYAFAEGNLVGILLEDRDLSVAMWDENKYLELPYKA